MAHYKRGKCRFHGKSRRNSSTFYRKRHGLKPYKIPYSRSYSHLRPGSLEWLRYWEWRSSLWPAQFWTTSNWPRSWDIQYHTRPRRRKEKRLSYNILIGRVDADDAAWPLEKKPHIYYW